MYSLNHSQRTYSYHNKSTQKQQIKLLYKIKNPVNFQVKQIGLQRELRKKNFDLIYIELGSPSNQFMMKKIQKISSPLSPKLKKTNKIKTQPKDIQRKNYFDQCQSPKDQNRIKTINSEKEFMSERAIIKNHQQRLARILLRHKEQEQTYGEIRSFVKMKSAPKKAKVIVHGPPKVSKFTWYQKWMNEIEKEGNRRAERIDKHFQIDRKRCVTEKIGNISIFQ